MTGNSGKARYDAMHYALRLQKMIQCATVSVKGAYEDTEFLKLKSIVEKLFPLVHKNAERMSFSEDCWLYRIKGRDTSRCILLMSHHDVAAVTGEWRFPAFSGEIAEGRIWGRGSVDTKTSLFAQLQALEELLEEGADIPCTVYLASSHNEEIAGDGIPETVNYFRSMRITPEFVLDEGGAVIEPPMPGIRRKCAVLAIHEKGRHTLLLRAAGSKEHAGLSGDTNTPAVRMAEFIVRMQKEQPYVRRFSPELTAMFEALAPHMQFPMRFIFGHLKAFSGILIKLIPKLNAQAGAMLGTTGTFQELETDSGEDAALAKLLLRCVDEGDLKKEIGTITKIAAEYGITVTDAPAGNEFHRPADRESRAYGYIQTCMAEAFPEAIVMPFILPAGTDARHFSELCPAVFRFAPIDIDDSQFKSVHGVNENICLEAIPGAVGFYRAVIEGCGVYLGQEE